LYLDSFDFSRGYSLEDCVCKCKTGFKLFTWFKSSNWCSCHLSADRIKFSNFDAISGAFNCLESTTLTPSIDTTAITVPAVISTTIESVDSKAEGAYIFFNYRVSQIIMVQIFDKTSW